MPLTTTQLITVRQPVRRLRWLRASWRDTRALLHQFRTSILAFMLVTVVGGYIYGELYFLARGEVIPLIDRPYIMLQLMILETPENAPPEWYLIAFWYTLPVIFVVIIGRGAADFVRLFFNRDERRDAWREAVASTYRNHVIVFGAGHVGLRVIRALANMGVEVVVIDNDPDQGVEEVLAAIRAPLMVGDGRVPLTLEKAGLRYADAFVCCTGNDHTNLEAIMRARDMNPTIRIVARVWDDQFARQIERFMNVQTVLSSSDLAAPSFAGAALGIDITQTLKVHGVDYSMIRLDVISGSFMDGQTVRALQHENDMDIVLYSRGEITEVQPAGDLVIRAGDTVVIFARYDRILNVVKRNRG